MSENKNAGVEYVKVEVSVPKPIVDFVNALAKFGGLNVEEFWQSAFVEEVRGLLQLPRHQLNPNLNGLYFHISSNL